MSSLSIPDSSSPKTRSSVFGPAELPYESMVEPPSMADRKEEKRGDLKSVIEQEREQLRITKYQLELQTSYNANQNEKIRQLTNSLKNVELAVKEVLASKKLLIGEHEKSAERVVLSAPDEVEQLVKKAVDVLRWNEEGVIKPEQSDKPKADRKQRSTSKTNEPPTESNVDVGKLDQTTSEKWTNYVPPKRRGLRSIGAWVSPPIAEGLSAIAATSEMRPTDYVSTLVTVHVEANPDLVEKGKHLLGKPMPYRPSNKVLEEEIRRLKAKLASLQGTIQPIK